jgi:hypothetical protein
MRHTFHKKHSFLQELYSQIFESELFNFLHYLKVFFFLIHVKYFLVQIPDNHLVKNFWLKVYFFSTNVM